MIGPAIATEESALYEGDIADKLRGWMEREALPFWAAIGFDRRRGGFHERLTVDGQPDRSAARRLLVQARQVYVFSHAFVLGWFPPGKALALDAVDFMLKGYWAPDGRPGFVHALPGDGVCDPLRDTYDHAFVLLALAWAARASGDAQIRALIDRTIAYIDEHLTASDGSLVEGLPARLPRRQNPHMHAFEAMLALKETIDHPQALTRAQRIHAMLGQKFFDEESATVGEYFTNAWARAAGPAGDCVEPGHQAEWSWLLRRYEALANEPHSPLPQTLLDSALRWSDPATGFLVDEASRKGPIVRASRRLWPQTELAKAWLGAAEAGRAGAADQARRVLAALARHYLDKPFAGGWIDQFDATGASMSNFVPASTLYHLFCAIAETDRVLGVHTPASKTSPKANSNG